MSPTGSGGGQVLSNLLVQFTLQGQQQLRQELAAVQQQTASVQSAVAGVGQQLQTSAAQMAAQTNKIGTAVQSAGANFIQMRKSMEQGFQNLIRAVGSFHMDLINRMGQVEAKTKEAKKPADQLAQAFGTLGGRINLAMGVAQASILGFVRQGLSLGTTGQMLQLRMERLSLAISGLFRPEIIAITRKIEQLTEWLGKLSDKQREQLVHWLQAGAAAVAMGVALPKIVAGLRGAAAAATLFGIALGFVEAETGIGAILPILGLLLQGFTALVVGTEGGRDALGRLWEAAKPLIKELTELGKALQLGELFEGLGNDIATAINLVTALTKKIAELVKKLNEMSDGEAMKKLWEFARAITPLGSLAAAARGLGFDKKLPPPNRETDVHRSTGFENVEDVYKRIAQMTVNPEDWKKRVAEKVDQIARGTDAIGAAVAAYRGPVAQGP